MQHPRQDGTVKWFSEAKGYGFITGPDGTDYYFHAKDVRGATLPRNGATVQFDAQQGKKGPAARSVEIRSQPAGSRDDRLTCPHCGKRMVPRIITDHGSLSHSVCPFCGGTIKSFRSWWPLIIIASLGLIVLVFIVLSALGSK
jgi:CspA family cold shock protein